MKTIKQLYSGAFEAVYGYEHNEKTVLSAQVDSLYHKLTKTLSEEQVSLLNEYEELSSFEHERASTRGFSIGARLIAEAFGN